MGKFGVACRAFWRAFRNQDFADQVEQLLEGKALPGPERIAAAERPKPKEEKKPKLTGRSDALSLLATLQREGRFLDFLQESLDDYPAEQVKSAVLDIHRDCRAAVERLFAMAPLVDQEEETELEVPVGYDAATYRLSGNVTGEPPFRGTLKHHGWKATKCEIPQYTGSSDSAFVVAAAEVEIP